MVTDRDLEAARRAMLRFAANYGYQETGAYAEMVKYIAEAIALARLQGREENTDDA